jgi:hypothetical protein
MFKLLSYSWFSQAPLKTLPYHIDIQELQAITQQECFWIFTSLAQLFSARILI